MVVQHQRPLLRRGVLQVPDLAVQEVRVLGVDPGDLVERDGHGRGAVGPFGHLVGSDLEPFDHPLVRVRQLSLQSPQLHGRLFEVEPRHHVGEEVVVDHRRVLVRAGDAVDVEEAVLAEEAQ